MSTSSLWYHIKADDNAAILDILTLFLEDMGYEVKTTQDGETLHTMGNDLPDMLVLDIWMSGWHGRDICRFLKSQKETRHLPIRAMLERTIFSPNPLTWRSCWRRSNATSNQFAMFQANTNKTLPGSRGEISIPSM